jgi:hypothetical protein
MVRRFESTSYAPLKNCRRPHVYISLFFTALCHSRGVPQSLEGNKKVGIKGKGAILSDLHFFGRYQWPHTWRYWTNLPHIYRN